FQTFCSDKPKFCNLGDFVLSTTCQVKESNVSFNLVKCDSFSRKDGIFCEVAFGIIFRIFMDIFIVVKLYKEKMYVLLYEVIRKCLYKMTKFTCFITLQA